MDIADLLPAQEIPINHLFISSSITVALWVFIPFGIMVDSYAAIMKAFKVANAHMKVAKGKTL